MQTTTIGSNQAGQRLDKFLHKYLPNAGSGFLYKMLRKKNITLNGRKAAGSELLKEGDFVCCFFSEETFGKLAGRTPAKSAPGTDGPGTDTSEYEKAYGLLGGIQVVYEDDSFLFLNKPAGTLTQKAKPEDYSLNEWMIGYLLRENPSLANDLATFRPSVCNRLDRNTSGIVLCGKTLGGLQFLSLCIKERRIRKLYHTICAGELKKADRVQGYLEKDEKSNRVRISMGREPGPRQSYIETGYTPLSVSHGCTYLEVELVTGKTHQIRAQLAGIGHPLLGDFKYGEDKTNRRLKQEYGLTHQLLHASRVVFPETGSGVGSSLSGREFTAPEPELFARVRAGLGL